MRQHGGYLGYAKITPLGLFARYDVVARVPAFSCTGLQSTRAAHRWTKWVPSRPAEAGFGVVLEEAKQVMKTFWRLWHEEEGQDIAEYAVMLAVILVIVVGTIRLIGSNANNVFSNVASSIQ